MSSAAVNMRLDTRDAAPRPATNPPIAKNAFHRHNMIMEEALGARVVEGVREATELSVRDPRPAYDAANAPPKRVPRPSSPRPRAPDDGLAAGYVAGYETRAPRRSATSTAAASSSSARPRP